MRPGDKQALQDWEQFRKLVAKSSTIDHNETADQQAARIKELKGDWTKFFTYYFPHYCTAEFAPFQHTLMRQLEGRDRALLANIIARAHAKSAMAMMAAFFLMANDKAHNILLTSWNEGNAQNLLTPFRIQLESNERLKHDFGPFQGTGQWEAGNFTTLTGCSFRAIGSGQSPRGARNDEARPDLIIADDFDEDQQCRNPKRVREAKEWLMGALFGCFDITGRAIMIVTGNIIAPNTVLAAVEKVADWSQRVNIYDKEGRPSWPQRFTKEECDWMIAKAGYALSQREYFNNPILEGTTFKPAWIRYAELPKLSAYRVLIGYLDPGFKKTATSDTKAWVLVGLHKGEIHVVRAFVAQATVQEMIGWGYAIKNMCDAAGAAVRLSMEEVFLQDLLYEDFKEVAKLRGPLPLKGDKRKKPDKDARIEAISGYFERGQVVFNAAFENEDGMRQLHEQLINFEPGVKTRKDGPDALEGAIHQLQTAVGTTELTIGQRGHNKYGLK